jgi:hypothetical protein
VREEDRRERQDRDESGQDERKPTDQAANAAAKAPGAVDRKLRRGRAGEEVAGGDRILELGR